MLIFHCWKQCCRSSFVMLFKSCVAFDFTASTESNLNPLSADLFLGREKSRTVLGPESTVDVPSLECCFLPNTSSQIARCRDEESMRHSSTCLVSFVAHVHGRSSKHFYNEPDWQSDLQAPNQCRLPPGYRKKQSSLLWIWTCYARFLLPTGLGALPMHGL